MYRLQNGTKSTSILIHSSDLINFVDKLNIPTEEKERLLKLTPQTYIGYAEKLSKV